MGIFTDFLADAKTFDTSPASDLANNGMRLVQALQSKMGGDRPYPSGYEAVDEVQELGNVTADDGTLDIAWTIDGVEYVAEAIDHDDDAAAVQTIVDTAFAGLTGYTAGDVEVTGGPIDTAPLVFTFGGVLAGRNIAAPVVTNELLDTMEAAEDPAFTEDTRGGGRAHWAILKAAGIIADAAPPDVGEALVVTAGPNLLEVNNQTIRVIAKEAGYLDGNLAVEAGILSGLGINS
jgi:hypothetical protein